MSNSKKMEKNCNAERWRADQNQRRAEYWRGLLRELLEALENHDAEPLRWADAHAAAKQALEVNTQGSTK